MLYLGFGQAARHHAEFVQSSAKTDSHDDLFATTRDITNKQGLIKDLQVALLDIADHCAIEMAADGQKVLVSLPPDAPEQDRLAALVSRRKALIYLSSTGVYGTNGRKEIDLETPPLADNPQAEARLAAEAIWLAAGAVILRLPGLYDRQNNVVSRILQGKYRIPGDGSNYVSRIHLEDLARIIDLSFALPPGQIWLVGDQCPATHLEIASYVCKEIGIDLPDFAPLDEVHYTMRSDRRVDGRALLDKLGYRLIYPDFRAGLKEAISSKNASFVDKKWE
jgi:hypothetical protein